jgi:hypothetical protein
MRRIPTALAQVLLALGSFALLRGSTCVVVYCSETCDPCLTQCKCHTCQGQHAQAYGPAHQLVAFELSEQLDAQGMKRQTLAWIGGLSVVNATTRTDVTARDFREFAEGVLGVNHELLDLEPALGYWSFGSVELAGEFALVTFTRVEAAGGAGEGTLEFVFDARGGLHEIVRALPRS